MPRRTGMGNNYEAKLKICSYFRYPYRSFLLTKPQFVVQLKFFWAEFFVLILFQFDNRNWLPLEFIG